MKILCDTQGDQRWHDCRRGHLTASRVGDIIAGKHTKRRQQYLSEMVLDLEDAPELGEVDPAPWYIDGKKYESWARGWYSWEYDVDVSQTGFVEHDDYAFIGCSPDGLLPENSGMQIKYRKSLRTFKQHTAKGVRHADEKQMQFEMWVCGARRWRFVNYWRSPDHEKEQGHVQLIERDESMISYIEEQCLIFWRDVLRTVRDRSRGRIDRLA